MITTSILRSCIEGFVIGVIIILILVGTYWLAKHGSYWLWYDGMVENTIRELIKPECFR